MDVPGSRTDTSERFRLANAVKFVPKFDETNVEHYLLAFEKSDVNSQFSENQLDGSNSHPTDRESAESFF